MTTPPAPFTAAAQRLVNRAEQLGLRPEVRPAYRGIVQVALNGCGPESGFGALYIGARSGKVSRLVLRWDNDDARHTLDVRHRGYLAARAALEAYASVKGR